MKSTDNFKIDVINRQTIDNDTDTICENSRGSLREGDGKFYLMYRTESQTVMIKITEGRINVKRTGEYCSDMEYIKGKHTAFPYKTPYGIIDMEIITHDIRYRLDSNGGEIQLVYDIITSGDKMSNKMEIRITKI